MREIEIDVVALSSFIEEYKDQVKYRCGYTMGSHQFHLYRFGDKVILSYENYGHLSTPDFFNISVKKDASGKLEIFSTDFSEDFENILHIKEENITTPLSELPHVEEIVKMFFPFTPDIKEPDDYLSNIERGPAPLYILKSRI